MIPGVIRGTVASLVGLAGLVGAGLGLEGLLLGGTSPLLVALTVGGCVVFVGGWAVSVLYEIAERLRPPAQ